jgi:hypothetical protein
MASVRYSRDLSHDRIILLLAVVWLAAALPRLGARYSWDWDSSQFDRAVEKFDVRLHQPHPPGYPLWVLAMKGVTPLTGNPNSAQVVLSLIFTGAGLMFFASLARELLGNRGGLTATALLAFSPLVLLYAIVPLANSVDLFSSCAVACFAARIWSGETRWIVPACLVAAITAGFRESGVTLVLPLLAAALTRAMWQSQYRSRARRASAAGIVGGLAVWSSWLAPAAGLNGGLSNWHHMANAQMIGAFRQTSVFFGAPAAVHGKMMVEVAIYFALALSVLIPLSLAGRSDLQNPPVWYSPSFLALWIAPNLIVVFLLHCGKPGYILLSLPPLVLMALRRRNAGRSALSGAAVGILVSCLPYELLDLPHLNTAVYLMLRSSPRFAYVLEAGQRRMRSLLDAFPGSPDERLMICEADRPEAPNIRTVTFDFGDLHWTDDPRTQPDSGVRSVFVVCDRPQPSPMLLQHFPNLRRVSNEAGFSLWMAPVLVRRTDDGSLQNRALEVYGAQDPENMRVSHQNRIASSTRRPRRDRSTWQARQSSKRSAGVPTRTGCSKRSGRIGRASARRRRRRLRRPSDPVCPSLR